MDLKSVDAFLSSLVVAGAFVVLLVTIKLLLVLGICICVVVPPADDVVLWVLPILVIVSLLSIVVVLEVLSVVPILSE